MNNNQLGPRIYLIEDFTQMASRRVLRLISLDYLTQPWDGIMVHRMSLMNSPLNTVRTLSEVEILSMDTLNEG